MAVCIRQFLRDEFSSPAIGWTYFWVIEMQIVSLKLLCITQSIYILLQFSEYQEVEQLVLSTFIFPLFYWLGRFTHCYENTLSFCYTYCELWGNAVYIICGLKNKFGLEIGLKFGNCEWNKEITCWWKEGKI